MYPTDSHTLMWHLVHCKHSWSKNEKEYFHCYSRCHGTSSMFHPFSSFNSFPTSFIVVFDIYPMLAGICICFWLQKDSIGMEIGKEKVEALLLLIDYMLAHISKTKNSTKELLQLKNIFNKVVWYNINSNTYLSLTI